MKQRIPVLAALAALVLRLHGDPAAAQVSAQHLFRPGSVAVSLYGGGAAFSAFQQGTVRPAERDVGFQRRVSAHTSTALGAELLWWLSPSFGIRLHGSWLPSRLDVQFDEAGVAYLRNLAAADSVQWKRLDVLLADVSTVIRPPFTLGRVVPYAVIGGGIVSYRPRGEGELPPGTEAAFGGGARTAAAGVVGLGAAIPLQREDLVLSFAVTNHITRTPVDDRSARALPADATYDLIPESVRESGEDGVRLTSNVRLMVGLTVPLRRPR